MALGAALGVLAMASGCRRPPRPARADRDRRRAWPTPPSTSTRASAPTRRRRRRTSCSSARCSRSTPDLRVVPELAESVLNSRIAVTYVARLRRGVRFHNGRELTADGCRLYLSQLSRSDVPRPIRRVSGDRALGRRRWIRYTVAFTLKQPSRLVPDQPGDGDRAGRIRAGERAQPDRHRAVSAGGVRARRSAGRSQPFAGLLRRRADERRHRAEGRARRHDARPRAAQRHGRSRRQRPVPGHRLAAAARGPAAGRDRAGHRLRLHRAQPARSGSCRKPEVRKAIGYAIDREAIVKYLRRGLGDVGGRHRAADVVGVRARRVRLHATIQPRRSACSTRPGFRDPDGDGPLPRLRLSLKTSTSEVYRVQAAAIQHDLARRRHSPRRAVERAADALRRRRRAATSSSTRCSVRRRDRSGHAAPRLSFVSRRRRSA